jgi:hypothetical protein
MWASEIPRAIQRSPSIRRKGGCLILCHVSILMAPIFFKATVKINAYLGISHEFMNHFNNRDVEVVIF